MWDKQGGSFVFKWGSNLAKLEKDALSVHFYNCLSMPNILLEDMPHATEITSMFGLGCPYTSKGSLENCERFFVLFLRNG